MIVPLVAVILILDQLTKYLVTHYLRLHQSVPLVQNILHVTLVHNRGAAFGILKNQVPLFIATSLFAVVLIFANLRDKQNRHKKLYMVALGLILAGALGNLIDRLCFGYVIDFIDVRVWPVFNIADSVITVGALALSYSVLREK